MSREEVSNLKKGGKTLFEPRFRGQSQRQNLKGLRKFPRVRGFAVSFAQENQRRRCKEDDRKPIGGRLKGQDNIEWGRLRDWIKMERRISLTLVAQDGRHLTQSQRYAGQRSQ